MLHTIIAPMNDMDVHQTASDLQAAASEAGDMRAVRALDKAMLHYARGVRPTLTTGGWLIASATTLNQVYRVSATHGCNCEASAKGFICWHAAMTEILEAAQARQVPPTTRPRSVKQQAAEAALNELYG